MLRHTSAVRITTLLLFVTLSLFTAGCLHAGVEPLSAEGESSRWITTSQSAARGVVLLIHGLNMRPSAMDEIGNHLVRAGFHSYRLALRGHAHDEEGTFPAQSWCDDIIAAYSLARTTYPTLPLHIVAYSASGLIVTDVLARNPEIRPTSMALLAPALSLRTYVQIASVLSLFPPVSWRVRNVAPLEYRRFATTPLFWYRNVMDIYDDTRSVPHPEALRDIPTRVFVSPDDELVSDSGIVEWIGEHGLHSSWEVVETTPQPAHDGLFDHLIIDEASLGEVAWHRMLHSILELFTRYHRDNPTGKCQPPGRPV